MLELQGSFILIAHYKDLKSLCLPTSSRHCAQADTHLSRDGLFSRWPRMAFLIMVFLPMSTTALSRRHRRMACICLEPTLSAPTMKHLGKSSSSCCKPRKTCQTTTSEIKHHCRSWDTEIINNQ